MILEDRISPMKDVVMWGVGDSCNGYGKILRSEDGGHSWRRQGSVATIPTVKLAGVAAADRAHLWAVGGRIHSEPAGVILRSDDGGDSWIEWRDPATEAEILKDEFGAVVCVDEKTVWAVGFNGKIIHSTNGGETWEVQPSGTNAQLQGLWAVDSLNAWATGSANQNTEGVILHWSGEDRGWAPQGESTVKAGVLGVCSIDARIAWAVGSEWTVYYTTNGGDDWSVQFEGPKYDLNGISALGPAQAFFVADNDTLGMWSGKEWVTQTLHPAGYHLLRVRSLPDGRLLIAGCSNTGEEGGVIHVIPSSGQAIIHKDPVAMYDVTYAL